jgi:hypothetical protein
LNAGESVIFDFGNHHVGYVTLDLGSFGSHQDAPAYIYLKFAERLDELGADTDSYNGWISKGWIQEEFLHIDVLPAKLKLPRRYAFRYLEIKVIAVSLKFSLVVNEVKAESVSAVSEKEVSMLRTGDELLKK